MEKERELALARKELQENMDFNPFGRAGAGAPARQQPMMAMPAPI